MNELTVGKLKEKIKDVPDDYIVVLIRDTGVDEPSFDADKIVIEDAYVYDKFRQFEIYANERVVGE